MRGVGLRVWEAPCSRSVPSRTHRDEERDISREDRLPFCCEIVAVRLGVARVVAPRHRRVADAAHDPRGSIEVERAISRRQPPFRPLVHRRRRRRRRLEHGGAAVMSHVRRRRRLDQRGDVHRRPRRTDGGPIAVNEEAVHKGLREASVRLGLVFILLGDRGGARRVAQRASAQLRQRLRLRRTHVRCLGERDRQPLGGGERRQRVDEGGGEAEPRREARRLRA